MTESAKPTNPCSIAKEYIERYILSWNVHLLRQGKTIWWTMMDYAVQLEDDFVVVTELYGMKIH